MNRSLLNDFTDEYQKAGVRLFHFARPCLEVKGANIDYHPPNGGAPVITKGVKMVSDLSPQGGGAAERYMARMTDLVNRGFGGFYFDAMSCVGDTQFLESVATRWPGIFMAKEGCRDRDAYSWPQIPILKLPKWPANNSLLMRELRPLATYYGGSIDEPLSDAEFSMVLDKGYIGVVSNTPATFSPNGQARPRFHNTTCVQIARSLENQEKLWAAYGRNLAHCGEPNLTMPACSSKWSTL